MLLLLVCLMVILYYFIHTTSNYSTYVSATTQAWYAIHLKDKTLGHLQPNYQIFCCFNKQEEIRYYITFGNNNRIYA